ncbi:Tim44 domain-containing protein [Noviherbaspirillum cavernae]|uniref:Tim44 domain-containing protein n=1 Tax=Noviherbaspirillum cavernae TaxID=2320862 RepID=A0A418WXN7_9BURK|nr:Tim44-like domain-containing protein [Noviherbaspirillum cavernae]RJG04999.1 Tim44 domain-containing protein [Noviherbaspirillum cavernae]
MKRLFVAMLVAVSALSLVVTEAEAKRMGGGGSLGKQSQNYSRQAPAQSPNQQLSNQNQAKPAAPAAAPQSVPPKPASPWKNILGGALLGLGLGALLSHLGLGGALANVIGAVLMIALFALAAMFIVRLLRRNSGSAGNADVQPAYPGGYDASRTPDIGSRLEASAQPAALQAASPVSGAAAVAPGNVPADFDVPAFLRNAKTYFIRLQAAWDKADVNDIREFTSTEMFAELKLQLQERGASPNHTDVVSLDAELLGVETVGEEYMASVRFSGMIKEAENAPTEPFTEIWNLTKPLSGQGGWLLAGIQQLSPA